MRLCRTLLSLTIPPLLPFKHPPHKPLLNPHHLQTVLPILLVRQHQELTQLEWPSSGSPCGAPVAASQSRTVLSSEPDSTSLPSGEKATDLTGPEWPLSVCSAPLQFACPFEILCIPLIQSSNFFHDDALLGAIC